LMNPILWDGICRKLHHIWEWCWWALFWCWCWDSGQKEYYPKKLQIVI